MAEEKKEETAKSAESPAAEPAKAAGEKKEAVKAERPANCSSCNKSIKNKRWYYRNGKYFCSKRCWQAAAKKDKAAAAPAAPEAPAAA